MAIIEVEVAMAMVETITDQAVVEEPITIWSPCALCSGFNHSPKHCFKGEHDINNLMEKMSLGSSNQHQNGLY